MSYTYKALTLAWLTVFGLAALSGSGMITGPWVLLLVGAALVLPGLTLSLCSKPQGAAEAITTSQGRALAGPAVRDPSAATCPTRSPWSGDAPGASRHRCPKRQRLRATRPDFRRIRGNPCLQP
jgi:hypothetical protein